MTLPLKQASTSKEWAFALTEAKAAPGFEASVAFAEKAMLETPPTPKKIFRIIFKGFAVASGCGTNITRLKPHCALTLVAWGKANAQAVDRRLLSFAMSLEHLAAYAAEAPAALAKTSAARGENFADFALHDAVAAMKRPGEKWGDVKEGIDPVHHVYEPIWRTEHSKQSSDYLVQQHLSGLGAVGKSCAFLTLAVPNARVEAGE